jgi:hypothetical protein
VAETQGLWFKVSPGKTAQEKLSEKLKVNELGLLFKW